MRKLLARVAAIPASAGAALAGAQGLLGVSLVGAGCYLTLSLGPALIAVGAFFLLGAWARR
jgi:hypothetical protein